MGEEYQDEHNLVLTSEIGTPVSLRNLERRFYKHLLKTAGLPDIRLYDLRHSCATLLLAAGENPKVVSERLWTLNNSVDA
jgi:integrase